MTADEILATLTARLRATSGNPLAKAAICTDLITTYGFDHGRALYRDALAGAR